MNLNEFKNKYMGKSIDYDGVSGVQCVDLVKQYLKDVFGLNPGSMGNAKDYFQNYENNKLLKDNFDRLVQVTPEVGDIVVWGERPDNKYGHVAICVENGKETTVKTLDLNWGGKTVKEVVHNYTYYLGVLRAKNKNGGEEEMKRYVNGSTSETVYADTNCTNKIGSLNPRESCDCFGIFNNRAMVRYKVDGTNNYKIGFCKWTGGVQ